MASASGSGLKHDLLAARSPRGRRAILRGVDLEELQRLLQEAGRARRTRPREAGILARCVLVAARAQGAEDVAARATRIAAQADLILGRARTAVRGYHRAARFERHTNDPGLAAELAQAMVLMGDGDGALRALRHARRSRANALAAPPARARLLASEGNVLLHLERTDEAMSAFEQARALLDEHDAPAFLPLIDANLAIVHARRGDYGEASRQLLRTADGYERAGFRLLAMQVRANLAYLQVWQGHSREAIELLEQLAQSFSKEGDARNRALTILDRAEIDLRIGRYAEAREAARSAVATLDQLGLLVDAARARYFIAASLPTDCSATPEDLRAARTLLAEAKRRFRAAGSFTWEAICLLRIAQLGWDTHQRMRAERQAMRAVAVLEGAGLADRAAHAHLLRARIAYERDRIDEAIGILRKLEADLRKHKQGVSRWTICRMHHQLSLALAVQSQRGQAVKHSLRAARELERERLEVPVDAHLDTLLRERGEVIEHTASMIRWMGGPRAADLLQRLTRLGRHDVLADLMGFTSLHRRTGPDELSRPIDSMHDRIRP